MKMATKPERAMRADNGNNICRIVPPLAEVPVFDEPDAAVTDTSPEPAHSMGTSHRERGWKDVFSTLAGFAFTIGR
jgi:hypothetical protein